MIGLAWNACRLAPMALVCVVLGCGSEQEAPSCTAGQIDVCRVDQMGCDLVAETPECVPCDAGHYAAKNGQCTALAGELLSHTYPENSTAAGAEIRGMCRSWTLENDEQLYVNAVELQQSEASHHSNWTFVPEDEYDGPDGIWPCAERDYSQLSATLVGGVLYAQSTQATHEVQKFPDGVVVRLPERVRIISDIHTLNTTAETVVGNMSISLYTIAKSDVTVELTPFHVTYDELAIPPQSDARFTGECELDSNYQAITGKPAELELYYLLPHTHALGTRMFVEVMGGPADGTSLIDVVGFNGEARGKQFDPPIDVSGMTGLRFGCEFHNPRDETVHWGFDDQEMCEALGFARSPVAFESRVSEANEDGEDEGTLQFTGACSTLALPWSQ